MREIKFRAWSKYARKMISPDFIDLNGNCFDWNDAHGAPPLEQDKDDYILIQYTGLKDKNGKEIYEGDLCKHKGRERVYKVEFDYNGARPFHPDIYSSAPNDSTGTFYPITIASSNEDRVSCCQEWEIIGNIYENSELLEGIKT